MPWDPNQYHKFQEQRSAPFYDLLALVDVRPNLQVVDLGCGTGELTRQLADRLPGSKVTGLDSSPQMLEKAAAFTGPGLQFVQGDQAQLDALLHEAAAGKPAYCVSMGPRNASLPILIWSVASAITVPPDIAI